MEIQVQLNGSCIRFDFDVNSYVKVLPDEMRADAKNVTLRDLNSMFLALLSILNIGVKNPQQMAIVISLMNRDLNETLTTLMGYLERLANGSTKPEEIIDEIRGEGRVPGDLSSFIDSIESLDLDLEK